MFDIKNMSNGSNCHGRTFILFWVFSISLMHTVERGDHIHIGFGLGPLETSIGLHIWRKLLP
jgi:hypothetical protein